MHWIILTTTAFNRERTDVSRNHRAFVPINKDMA